MMKDHVSGHGTTLSVPGSPDHSRAARVEFGPTCTSATAHCRCATASDFERDSRDGQVDPAWMSATADRRAMCGCTSMSRRDRRGFQVGPEQVQFLERICEQIVNITVSQVDEQDVVQRTARIIGGPILCFSCECTRSSFSALQHFHNMTPT